MIIYELNLSEGDTWLMVMLLVIETVTSDEVFEPQLVDVVNFVIDCSMQHY